MKNAIYIAVGSNIDPEENVVRALELLLERLQVSACSTFFWSAPAERPEQDRFLNGVWQAHSSLSPQELKRDLLRPIEHQLGRRRESDRHAARPIDLDLVLHGATVSQDSDLQLPDPDIPKRPFLWQPLAELAGDTLASLGLVPTAQALERLEPDHRITNRLRQVLDASSNNSPSKADR